MRVKDLLQEIERIRERYPDIDDWEIYLEQENLLAPEHNISYEEALKQPTVNIEKYEEDNSHYVLTTSLGDKFYYDSYQAALDAMPNVLNNIKKYQKDLKSSYNAINKQKSQGWKFVYDSEGWVYKDCAYIGDHIANVCFFEKEKILGLSCNY